MIIYFNLLIITLQILSAYSVSIRNRQFRDELVPYLNSRLENYKRDPNSLRIVSDDPFIIQLQVPENWDKKDAGAKGDKEKRGNKKRPPSKRFPKLKSWRRRLRIRRDIHEPSSGISPATTEPKLNQQRKHLKGIRRINNQTSIYPDIKNSVNRQEIKKVLNQVIKEAKTNRSRDFKTGEERRELEKSKFRNEKLVREKENSQKTTLKNLLLMMSTLQNRTSHRSLFPFPDRSSIVKLTHPIAVKSDQFKNGYREMKSDRDKIENKIKNLRNLLKVNDSISNEDLARVRRKTDSDKLANKIAKMFLTLSAVNGMNERKKSKCKDDEDDEDDLWEQERRINPTRKNYSTNEERYKVKKWIEHMKNKRSGKTCPCMAGPTATGEFYDDPDVFPLEQKLGKDYTITAPDTSSEEESLEVFRNRQRNRKYYSAARQNRNRPRYFKSSDDADNKLNALTKRGRRKFELPMEDLESYRSRAKQILQNAEEILDKLKEEEEKRLTNPNMFLSNLKEITSRIQADPRSHDNDLIKMLQKSLGISKGENDKNAFIEGMKTYVLDPYEKAKALTDESTRQLTNYLLKNLANVGNSGEEKDKSEALKAPEIKPLFQGVATDNSEPNKNVDLLKDMNENIEKYSQISLPLPDREGLKSSVMENPLQRQMNEMFKMQNEKMKDLSENTNEMSETDAMKHLKDLEDVVKDFTKENERSGQGITGSNIEEPSGLGERLKFLTDRKQGINQKDPLLTGDKVINNPINTDPTKKDYMSTEQLFGLSKNPEYENTMTSNNFQPEIDGKEFLGNKKTISGDDTTVGNVDVTSTDIKPTLMRNEDEEVMKSKEMDPDIIKTVSDEGILMKKEEGTENKEKVLEDGSFLKLDDPKTELEEKENDYGVLTSEGMDYQEKKPERDDLREPLISQVEKAGSEPSKEKTIDDSLTEIVEKAQDIESVNPDENLGNTNNDEINQFPEAENENSESLVKSALNDELMQTLEALDQNVEELIKEEYTDVENLPEKIADFKESSGNGNQEENSDVRAENTMNALSSSERQNLDSTSKENKDIVSTEKGKETDFENLGKKHENSKEVSGKGLEEIDVAKSENVGESKEDKETITSEKDVDILGKKNENSKEISGKSSEEIGLKRNENVGESKQNKETVSSEKDKEILEKQNENSKEFSGKNLEDIDSIKSKNIGENIENRELVSSENEKNNENSGKENENSKEIFGKSLEKVDLVKKENVKDSKDSKETVSSENEKDSSKKKNENFSKEISGKNSEEAGLKRDENVGENIDNKEIVSSENEKDTENSSKKKENSKEISGTNLKEVDLVKSENVGESIENAEGISSENESDIENLGKKNENSKEISGKSLEEIDTVKSENVGESKDSKKTDSSEHEKDSSKKKNENFSKEISGKNLEEIDLKKDENVGESIDNKEIVSSENERDIENLGKKYENSKEISGKSLEEIDIVKTENVGESKDNKETVSLENKNEDFQNLSQKDENRKESSEKSLEEVGTEKNENVGKTQELSKGTSELRDTSEKNIVDTGDEKVTLPEPNAKEDWNTENEKENSYMSDRIPSTLDEIFAKVIEEENPMVAKAQNEEEAVGRNDDSENTSNTDVETGKSLLGKMNSNERSDSREKDENISGILSPLKESSGAKDTVENAGMETNNKESTDVRAENPMDSMQKELDENKDYEISPDLEEKTSEEKVSSKATEMSNENERTGSALGDENTNVMDDDSMKTTNDNDNILEKVQSKEMSSVENEEKIADLQNLSKEISEIREAVEENISDEKNNVEDATEIRAENPIDDLTEQDIFNKPDDLISNAFYEDNRENKNLENDEADTVRKEEGLTQDGDDMVTKEEIEPKADILYDMVKEGDNMEDSLKYPDAENGNNEELLEKVRSEDNMEKEDNIGEAEETGSEVLNLANAAEELQNGYEEMKSDQSDVQMENDALRKGSGSSKELNEKAGEELVEVENPSMTEMEEMQSNGDDDGSITKSSYTDSEAKTGNVPEENGTLVQMNEQENVEVPEEKSENIVEDSQTNDEDVLMPKYGEYKPFGDNADQNDKNDDPIATLVQTADEGMFKKNEAGESPEVESVRKESQDLPDEFQLKENEAKGSPEEVEGMRRESEDFSKEYQLKENKAGESQEEVESMRRESQDLSDEHEKNDEITRKKNESFEELTEPDGEKESKDDTFTMLEQREDNDSNAVESEEDPALTITDAVNGKETDDVLRESYTPGELVRSGNQEEKDKSAELSEERDDESAVQSIRDENTDENAEPREESSDENLSGSPVKTENVFGNDGDEMTLGNMKEAAGMSTEENVSGQNTGDEAPKNQANDYGELRNNAQEEKDNSGEGKEYDENLRLKNIDPNYQTSGEMGRHEHIYEYEENKSADMYDDFDNLVGSHEDSRYIDPTNRRTGENLRSENLLKDADYENFIDEISELTKKEGKEYADYYQGRGRFPPSPDQLMKSKPGKIKIPQSIGKIMKDLGESKDDLQNLGPDQIDHLIDKLEEADEQEQKESEEVDCREECACADNIRAISRNRGRYEIMKDVLLWMKDMQLNRVLSD